ncbi:pupal cuticle protein 36-like [Macrobrachium rosenbergii]|uniref:pupal cuticle protein 36-like n=1 Tax=Macrobrachium rosenbergii TaxID=79674 RepID=UPI0034D7868A
MEATRELYNFAVYYPALVAIVTTFCSYIDQGPQAEASLQIPEELLIEQRAALLLTVCISCSLSFPDAVGSTGSGYGQNSLMPYQFSYDVKDNYKGVDFGQQEKSDGNAVTGSYQVVLPDGRIQNVEYRADHQTGFVAKVSYSGQAQHPQTYGPAITFPSSYGNTNQGNGQGGNGFGYGGQGSNAFSSGSQGNGLGNDGFGYGGQGSNAFNSGSQGSGLGNDGFGYGGQESNGIGHGGQGSNVFGFGATGSYGFGTGGHENGLSGNGLGYGSQGNRNSDNGFGNGNTGSSMSSGYMYRRVLVAILACIATFIQVAEATYNNQPMPYNFNYNVNDDYKGLNFGHKEQSDGNVVFGSYTIVLPDGRKQNVEYTADHENGFIAKVSYVGEAQHPQTYGPAITFKPTHGSGGGSGYGGGSGFGSGGSGFGSGGSGFGSGGSGYGGGSGFGSGGSGFGSGGSGYGGGSGFGSGSGHGGSGSGYGK